jgi:hypothetical protein
MLKLYFFFFVIRLSISQELKQNFEATITADSPWNTFLGSSEFTESLKNYLYYDVEVGSSKQKLSLALDLNSNWIWIPISSCENCPVGTKTFNPSNSQSFQNSSSISLYSDLTREYIEGKISLDTFQIGS